MPVNTYTHGHAEAVLRSHRWRTAANSAAYLLPHLHPGQRLLDVGCGPGHDHRRPGPPGAARSSPSRSTPRPPTSPAPSCDRQGVTNATVVVGDVHDLDLGDAAGGRLRRRPRPPGPPARGRPGRLRCARWLRVTRPGGRGRRARQRLRPLLVAPRVARASTGGWPCTTPPPAPTAASRTRAGCCSRGPTPPAPPTSRRARSTWCFATPEDRRWWGGLWADRLTGTALAPPAARRGSCDPRRAGRGRRGLARVGRGRRRVVLRPARRGAGPGATPYDPR